MLCVYIWITQTSSLPKYYHRLHSKGGPPVREFRRLERLGDQVTRTYLDVEFWNRCLDLDICPKFVKFKPPKLKQYDSNDQLFRQVVCNSLKLAEKEHSDSKRRFYKFRQAVIGKLSLLEKRVLTHLLNKHFETTAKKKRSSHNKKLLNTWTKDRPRSPDCIKNLSSRTLSVEERNVLYRGLTHHILPDKMSP